MAHNIVVAFRMSRVGMKPGAEGSYLTRARALCVRGEALGGRLVAWSAAMLAMSWDSDKIEKAVLLATSIREEALSSERAWACGMAEGELETLSPDGQGILAWGSALLSAASLAHVAAAGEVVVDADLGALSAGQLSLLGTKVSTDAGGPGRGLRLDLEHPWKRQQDQDRGPIPDVDVRVEAAALGSPPSAEQCKEGPLAARIRDLAQGTEAVAAVDALAELRRSYARAKGGPPASRCQAALALAMTLSIAGRPDDALLDALDALARAREGADPKAIGACMALLAKLYAGAGLSDAALALREGIVGARWG